jgi:hypothetical protein
MLASIVPSDFAKAATRAIFSQRNWDAVMSEMYQLEVTVIPIRASEKKWESFLPQF